MTNLSPAAMQAAADHVQYGTDLLAIANELECRPND